MKIENNAKAIFEFKATDYFLVLSMRDEKSLEKEWSLNYRVDRSYKGKDDDVGMPIIFLSEKEAEECKQAGFEWVEI